MAKPELKVAIKDAESGEVTHLFAFWRNDGGRLSGKLDGKVRAIKVQLEDGTVVTMRRTDEKRSTHYVNAYENDRPAAPAPAQRSGARGGARDFADDDELPF